MKLKRLFFFVVIAIVLGALAAQPLFRGSVVHAEREPASLFVAPASGSFTIGSTFAVSIFINTGEQSINTVEANLKYPADKLQVVSPSSGKSVIGIWFAQPSYDNSKGEIRFRGATPNPGINSSQGLISQITFRVIGIGTAALRFEDSSRVLLNDGKGTDILGQMTNGVYQLMLPPPEGPIVTSPDHPDQEKWYNNSAVTFVWAIEEGVQGYSYILNDSPVDIPDNVSNSTKNNQTHQDVEDGVHYFHIKSLRENKWGGVTHYAIKIDTVSPADFPISIIPSSKTTSRRVSVDFTTTDLSSGVDHYEIKIIPLTPSADSKGGTEQPFFIEASSPYIAELDLGDYDAVIRAYDRAGNYVQATERIYIVSEIFNVVEKEGLRVRGNFVISWIWIWGIVAILIFGLGYLGVMFWKRHRALDEQRINKELPEDLKKQLEELKELREKYKKLTSAVLMVGMFGAMCFFASHMALAAGQIQFAPPLVGVISKNITNQEIFYIGGKTDTVNEEVIIYLQNMQTAETLSETVKSDQNGDWFYSHSQFLSSGQYLLWTQAKIGEQLSPPSPQVTMLVSPAALQFGASRLSYEAIYLFALSFLSLVILALLAFWIYHYYHSMKKRRRLIEEVKKVEESLKRGFAILRRDVEAELHAIQKAKSLKELSEEEKEREEKILSDLERISTFIGKEIWEIDQELEKG